ncbi:MAG: TOBE domain-containing protein, partial [Bacillota bacterium]|nr:TOBE domain-containing protein [Bacillota bacterium]
APYPQVLLLDEPLSALDARVRDRLRVEIRRWQRMLGITTLLVTHDQGEALALADRVAILRDGRLEQVGTPQEIYHHPVSDFVATFVGTSSKVEGRAAGPDRVQVAGGFIPLPHQVLLSGPVVLYLRPEEIQLSPAGEGGLPGRLVVKSFLGSVIRWEVELEDGQRLFVDVSGREAMDLKEGEKVRVAIPAEAVKRVEDVTPQQAGAGMRPI